ncbi:hypothetical protein L596_016438 [Steinernema carpocapsae]|uniref:7TM GPCR serpentine receptor class x (Srx) domain-containing protein n=1 Tax=Steinernema carpocapsae TaxID=34508 RepID=A0A4U5NI33_STECR|nr:hypothetical protein L596_016438 [Steinernema carpocapsae]
MDTCFCGFFNIKPGTLVIAAISLCCASLSVTYKITFSMFNIIGFITFSHDAFLSACSLMLISAIVSEKPLMMVPYMVAQVIGLIVLILLIILFCIGILTPNFLLEKLHQECEDDTFARMIFALLTFIFIGIFVLVIYFVIVVRRCYKFLSKRKQGYLILDS